MAKDRYRFMSSTLTRRRFFGLMARLRMLRFLARMMIVPSASTVKWIASPTFKPAASRTLLGIVVRPLLVKVANDMFVLTPFLFEHLKELNRSGQSWFRGTPTLKSTRAALWQNRAEHQNSRERIDGSFAAKAHGRTRGGDHDSGNQ
jgi:hypothetical protein